MSDGGARSRLGAVLLLMACIALPAQAELWGFVDASGVAHNKLLATIWNAMGLKPITGFGDPAYAGTLDSQLLA